MDYVYSSRPCAIQHTTQQPLRMNHYVKSHVTRSKAKDLTHSVSHSISRPGLSSRGVPSTPPESQRPFPSDPFKPYSFPTHPDPQAQTPVYSSGPPTSHSGHPSHYPLISLHPHPSQTHDLPYPQTIHTPSPDTGPPGFLQPHTSRASAYNPRGTQRA
jgi:hypothetical protein